MARTAPVPNIPPIPGMNPCTWLAGGGAGGGGSGSGSGKGGDGDANAEGNSAKEDPNGGDKGAGSCGNGAPGSCSNCGNNISVGDPVDVGTGVVFTWPVVDLALPGPLPLSIRRTYSSASVSRDVGMGRGWTHSLAWHIDLGRRTVEVWDGNGSLVVMPVPEVGGHVIGYDTRLLYRYSWGLALLHEGLWRLFFPDEADPRKHRLGWIEDNNGNRIRLFYKDGKLNRLEDSVGRIVEVSTDPNGHITSLAVSTSADGGRRIHFASYKYDANGNLSGVSDALGLASHYRYNADALLASSQEPGRLTFHYRYDSHARCVETWGAASDGSVPALSKRAPAVLADGTTQAKGMYHNVITYGDDGFREIADSVQVRRVFANRYGLIEKAVSNGNVTEREFDKDGKLLVHVDALGGVTRFDRENGYVTRITNPIGETQNITRDDAGRPTEFTDALGPILKTTYDSAGNVIESTFSLGDTWVTNFNSRGLPIERIEPNGGRQLFEYDDHFNLARITKPDGKQWSFTYDYLGRMISHTGSDGATTHYERNDKGQATTIRGADGNATRMRYNDDGYLSSYSTGLAHYSRDFNGVGKVSQINMPNGAHRRFLYNREGRVDQILNERGQPLDVFYDPEGLVLRVDGFDGRSRRYKYDGMGRLTTYQDGAGAKYLYEYDLVGQLKKIEFPDGTLAELTHDVRGRVTGARNAHVQQRFDLDGAGQVLREETDFDGYSSIVTRKFDISRCLEGLASSEDLALTVTRDVVTRPTEMRFDSHIMRFRYDACGNEISRSLMGEGTLESQYYLGELRRRSVTSPNVAERFGVQEPPWVGEGPPNATVSLAFAYDEDGKLTHRWDNRFGVTAYEYDANERLLATFLEGVPQEAFSYDAANNHSERSRPRNYDSADRLLNAADYNYSYDLDGRLIEKAHVDGTQRWLYAWSASDTLESVTRPDGVKIDFLYDVFGRRMQKRVLAADHATSGVVVSRTRFVWDGDVILQEITEEPGSATARVSARSYLYDRDAQPLAQRDSTRETGAAWQHGEWLYFVNDPLGTPDYLVNADGREAARFQRAAFGATQVLSETGVWSPLRFPGQYEDSETGLHYNRYRYYDPDVGRYITQDPAAGVPDSNRYRYCTNPVMFSDDFGLGTHNVEATFENPNSDPPIPAGTKVGSGHFNSGPDERMYDDEHTGKAEQYREKKKGALAKGCSEEEANRRAGMSAHYSERFGDTEATCMRTAKQQFKGKLAGGKLTMRGDRPPCTRCRGRMEQFAQENGCTVEYHYPRDPNHPNPPHGKGSFVSNGTFKDGKANPEVPEIGRAHV